MTARLIGIERDGLPLFRLRGGEIRAEIGTQIGVGHQSGECQKRQIDQNLDQSPHAECPVLPGLVFQTYIWPFVQDHVIHDGMSDFQQSAETTRAVRSHYALHKTVALVGMMGAGKTAVGRALAARLGVPFLDSDAEIQEAANMTVQEIFARDGEPFFRRKEVQVIARLLSGTPCILSTGGGAFLAEENRQAISRKGVSVWLDADLDLLWTRVRHRSTRPLLRTENPRQTLKEIYEARGPIYALADLSVKADPAYAIDDMVDAVIRTLLSRPDVLEGTYDR
jgi:shikimate kinase